MGCFGIDILYFINQIMTQYKYLKKDKIQKNTWFPFIDTTPEEYIGFVYAVYKKKSKEVYIGITRFWENYILPPLKGRKNKRHFLKETHWRTYTTSGKWKEDIEKNPLKYDKLILRLCKTKTELKAYEAYLILKSYFEKNYLYKYVVNEMVNLRLRLRKK